MKLYTVYVLAFLLTNFHFLSALNSQSLGLPVWPLFTGFEQSGPTKDDTSTTLHQYIAWGLGGAALAAGVTGAFWLALGGEDDPVQSRPVFSAGPSGLAAGWSLDF